MATRFLDNTVDFEYFRGWLVEDLGYGEWQQGRSTAVQPGHDVQGFDTSGPAQPLGCAHGVHDP